MQPFHPVKGDEINYLGVLADLSNEDKHRFIHPVFAIAPGAGIPFPSATAFRDCERVGLYLPGMERMISQIAFRLGQRVNLDTPILELPVRVMGKSPDVDMEPHLTGEIAFSKGDLRVLPTLDGIGDAVVSVLALYDPVFP